MIFLILSIFCSTLLFVAFKLFQKFEISTIHAIVINYVVASACGIMFSAKIVPSEIIQSPWVINAMIIGVSFIILFYLIALTTQKIGLSVASVSNKMSVVIPVIAAIILYNDSVSIIKVLGILLAIIAVFLASIKDESIVIEKKYLFLPLILFIGNGLIDTYIKYTETYFLEPDETNLFLTVLFVCAGISGLLFIVFSRNFNFQWKDVIGGVLLGIPNYGSIYFLIKTLELPQFESSVVFPLNNISIVTASSLIGLFIFNEKMNDKNKIGVLLSIVAIFIIAFLA
jgi:drug/metabolite transporter (DMT)-like permease